MTSSRLLVISSCTGDKEEKSPRELTLEDFADADRLARREHELASFRRPASVMYTGKQHEYLMHGVDKLRRAYGHYFVDLRILSAGYGLIDEDRVICPYDVTFSKWASRNVGRGGGVSASLTETVRAPSSWR